MQPTRSGQVQLAQRRNDARCRVRPGSRTTVLSIELYRCTRPAANARFLQSDLYVRFMYRKRCNAFVSSSTITGITYLQPTDGITAYMPATACTFLFSLALFVRGKTIDPTIDRYAYKMSRCKIKKIDRQQNPAARSGLATRPELTDKILIDQLDHDAIHADGCRCRCTKMYKQRPPTKSHADAMLSKAFRIRAMQKDVRRTNFKQRCDKM